MRAKIRASRALRWVSISQPNHANNRTMLYLLESRDRAPQKVIATRRDRAMAGTWHFND
jgi:hypothetical protein